MIIRKILRQFDNRISEAVKAAIMIGIGLQVTIIPGNDYLALRLLNSFMENEILGPFFTLIGSLRLGAIIANGTWKEFGAWSRAVGALIGSMIWLQMFWSVFFFEPPDTYTVGGPIFFVFSVIESFSIYRALGMRDSNGRGI